MPLLFGIMSILFQQHVQRMGTVCLHVFDSMANMLQHSGRMKKKREHILRFWLYCSRFPNVLST
jgi:hypothetical protein